MVLYTAGVSANQLSMFKRWINTYFFLAPLGTPGSKVFFLLFCRKRVMKIFLSGESVSDFPNIRYKNNSFLQIYYLK